MTRLDPMHPGEVLTEEFLQGEEIGALAAGLPWPRDDLAAFAEGKAAVTPPLAAKLAERYGTTSELWLNLQAEYDRRTAQRLTHDDGRQ